MSKENHSEEFHFFASSVADWIVTTDTRTLPDLIEFMDKAGYPYSLWMVPGNWDSNYEIKWYAPQVEGAKFLGHFKAPKERRKEAKQCEKAQAKLKVLEVA
jgi:hypothetical protein